MLQKKSFEKNENENENEENIILYGKRWFILLVFFLITWINCVVFITFGPITPIAEEAFGKTGLFIDFLTLCFTLPSIFLIFLGPYLIKVLGLKGCLILSGILNTAGCALRFVGSYFNMEAYYWLVLVGQVVAALIQPITLSAPPALASKWFGEKERTIATAIGALATLLGLASGIAFSTFIVKVPSNLRFLFMLHLILSFVTFLPSFFTSDKPLTHPSISSLEAENIEKTFSSELVECIREKHFWLLLLPFSLGYGIFVAIFTVLAQLVGPYGYSVEEAGIFGIVMMVSGVVGAAVFGIAIDVSRKYTIAMWAGYIGTGGGLVWMYFALKPDNYVLLAVAFGVAGFFSIAMLPVAMETAVELTFPVQEAISSGYLVLGGNIFGAVFTVLFNVLQKQKTGKMKSAFGYISISCCSAFIFLILYSLTQPQYKRLSFESLNNKEGDDSFVNSQNSIQKY